MFLQSASLFFFSLLYVLLFPDDLFQNNVNLFKDKQTYRGVIYSERTYRIMNINLPASVFFFLSGKIQLCERKGTTQYCEEPSDWRENELKVLYLQEEIEGCSIGFSDVQSFRTKCHE